MSEIAVKLSLLRDLAARHALDGILLQRVSSLAWATCGASTYVNIARSDAEAALLITAQDQFLICNNIEAPRLEKEEGLASQGWKLYAAPWFNHDISSSELLQGRKLGADGYYPGAVNLSGEIGRLRANLSREEGDRFRILGRLCAQAMDAAARGVRPGMTEYEIAGLLAREGEARGVGVIVNLIAVDERILNFRHPLPTAKKLDKYAMLVLCGRRWGLVCSLTRLVYFGKPPSEVLNKEEAVARVDATMIAATKPGRTLGQVFASAQGAYAAAGYPDEWQLHHQGGPTGYEPREYLATPASTDIVRVGQVYAWNPSITGYKSEDSVLIGADGYEILSAIRGWPVTRVETAGQVIDRPKILVVS